MIELFEKYVDWKILTHLIENPSQSFYVKEMARILDVSPGSVSTAVKRFKKWGLVTKEEKGQAHLYRLANDVVIVKELKKIHFLIKLQELDFVNRMVDEDEGIISQALYGSFATGDYDERSDIDLLIISSAKVSFSKLAEDFEKDLKRTINIQIFSPGQWTGIKEREQPFYHNVIRDHILLYGGELI
jgi:predicted nucleotidyltransferase/DNA-binding transcriptional ArsR family regulator